MMCGKAAIVEQLLPEVKNYLNITWDDEAEDRKVSGFIADAMFYLDDKAGEECDYIEPGYPRTLLMEHCRYHRDSALDVFETNYRAQILAMQNNEKVKRYVEKTV